MAMAQAPTDGEQRRLPFPLAPQEGWSTVIIAAILVLLTVGCVQNLNWTPNSGILTGTTLMGMLLGFALAKQRVLPQWLADIPALGLGILFAFWQTAGADTNGNVRLLWSHLKAWITGTRDGQASTDDVIFLLFLAILTMLLGYVSMWLIFRSRSPWLAAAANAVVLLINLNYATDDKIVYAVFFLLIALLLVVRFNFVERLRLWKRKGLRYPPELGWDVMQAGIIFIVVVLIIGATLPTHIANANVQNLWNGPKSPWAGVQNGFNRLFHVTANTGQSQVAFGKSLRISGNVNLPNTVVFTYTTDDVNGTYVQALTYDNFDKYQWSLTTTPAAQLLPLPANETYGGESVAVTPIFSTIHAVSPWGGDKNYLFGLGEPSLFSRDALLRTDGILLSDGDRYGSYTEWLAKYAVRANESYTEQGLISNATVDQLRHVAMPAAAKPGAYPTDLLDRYTQLPPELSDPASTPALYAAKTTGGKTTMYDKILAIIASFTTFRYSQTNKDVPNDTDAVSFFLQERQGFCTWFATALAVMLRELNIPSRVVEGFTNGKYDQKQQVYVTRGTDLHMWTQAYFPGYGWINFEPSVGFSQFVRPTKSSQPPGQTPPPTTRPANPTKPIKDPGAGDTPVKPPVGITTSGKGNGVSGVITLSLSTLLALILLALLAVAVWWRLLFRKLSPISQVFGRMATLGRIAGVPPAPAQTASEYGATLAARFPDQQPEIEAITELYVRERWAPDAPEPTTLTERWQQVRDGLVRRIGASLPARVRRRNR